MINFTSHASWFCLHENVKHSHIPGRDDKLKTQTEGPIRRQVDSQLIVNFIILVNKKIMYILIPILLSNPE